MTTELAPETPSAPAAVKAPAKGIAGKLQKKVGPFPLWLWLGIGGGVVLLLLKGSGKGGSSGDSTGTTDAGVPADAPSAPGIDIPGGGQNVGGFEDPVPTDTFADPGFDWPDGNPGTPANPPADPVAPTGVTHPMLTRDVLDQVLRNTGYYVPPRDASGVSRPLVGSIPPVDRGVTHPAISGSGLLVHSGYSAAGRIAGATTTGSVSPNGQRTLQASSFGAASGRSFEAV